MADFPKTLIHMSNVGKLFIECLVADERVFYFSLRGMSEGGEMDPFYSRPSPSSVV